MTTEGSQNYPKIISRGLWITPKSRIFIMGQSVCRIFIGTFEIGKSVSVEQTLERSVGRYTNVFLPFPDLLYA